MKALFYDCFAGISGDMNLSAMLDLGLSKDAVFGELKKLNLDGWQIEVSKDSRCGIFGTKAEVIINGKGEHHHEHCEEEHHDCEGHHHHDEAHHHDCKSHHHEHSHAHCNCEEAHSQQHHHHEHRSFADIKRIILDSQISEKAKAFSLKIFEVIARAEAKVHNKPIDEVHFHEVGSLDSIIDIVAAGICADMLGVEKFICSPIELGGGTVRCAHGIMPVPAPATSEILQGKPVKLNGTNHEATTPTGAAIVSALCSEFAEKFEGKVITSGIGVGGRNPKDLPNILRVILFETDDAPNANCEKMFVAQANIDDMTSEELSYASELLFEAKAVDVWQESIAMKKSRLAVKLCALASKENLKNVVDSMLKNTTTLGVRVSEVDRFFLNREFVEKQTSLGSAKFKVAEFDGVKKVKPEFEDCKKIAKEKNISISEVSKILKNEF